MIDDVTVMILGAGSSFQYGFPTGPELKKWMLSEAQKPDTWPKHFDGFCPPEMADDLRNALIASPDDSIDAVLKRRGGLGPIGRMMIARRIASCEQDKNVFPARGWYKDLFHMLRLDDDNFRSPNLIIITFNYDRSLEYYLMRTIDSALEGHGQKMAKYKLKNIMIHHVHGSLGPLNEVPYGLNGNETLLPAAYENIRVISDASLDSSEEYRSAVYALQHAHRVFILGFGFDETNMTRLQLDKIIGKVPVYSTNYRLSCKADLINRYGKDIQFFARKVDDCIPKMSKLL